MSWKRLHVSILLLGAISVAVFLQPHILGDDAAISFRYASRLTGGDGLTYNDHERVQGFSNPLYTLLLAAMNAAGIDLITAARILGGSLYVVAILLTYLLGERLAGTWGGFLGGAGLLANAFFRFQALGGMESILSVCLGLAAILVLRSGAESVAGILIGLALVNKLDAGLLALAIAAAYMISTRRIPWRAATAAVTTALPWFVFAWVYYGSPIPNSLVVKIAEHAQGDFDRVWMLRILAVQVGYFLWIPVMFLVATLFHARESIRRFDALALGGWLLLHVAAFTVVDLGAPYPWYATAAIPPLLILAGAGVVAPIRKSRPGGLRTNLVVAILGAAFAVPTIQLLYSTTLQDLRNGLPLHDFEAFDSDRRLAGVFLDQFADAGEVVSSGYGWVAFESRRPFNDYSWLNSREVSEPSQYWVTHGVPWQTGSNPPGIPEGYVPLATFDLASTLFPGYSWFTVAGSPRSAIYRRGIRLLKHKLDRFPSMEPMGDDLGGVRQQNLSISAHPPSGIVFHFPGFESGPVRFRTRPGFAPELEEGSTDGVTFEVRVDGETRFREHRLQADAGEWITVDLPGEGPFELTLVTEPGPTGDRDFDWAWWWDPHILIGDGFVNSDRIRDRSLREEWCSRNPCERGG